MTRPKLKRRLRFNPAVYYYKPRGVPLSVLEEVELFPDELEALKLYQIDELNQTQAAKQMAISQPTFARVLAKANKKIAEAIIHGKAIVIQTKDKKAIYENS